jgi:flagellar motility protein MotE (MotC chaperone)
MTGRHAQPGGYLLLTLAVLLFVAGVSRLGLGVITAYADDLRGQEMVQATAPPLSAELIDTLRAREARLQADEARLAERTARLSDAQDDLRRQMRALEEAEAQLRATLSLTENAAEQDISRLVAVYEAMKPAQAAALFQEMEPVFSSGFLVRMRPEIAALILAELEPRLAYAISAIVAGRHANTPRD